MFPDFMSSKNADYLGIFDVTEVILNEHPSGTSEVPKGSQTPVPPPWQQSHLSSVFVTPARGPSPPASRHAHVLSIHFAYDWKAFSPSNSGKSVRSSCKWVIHG